MSSYRPTLWIAYKVTRLDKKSFKGIVFSIIELPYIDGCVWAYELSFWNEKLENLDKIDCLEPYYPDQINDRLIAQEGCFTLHPFPKENVPLIPYREY